jgi:hypothetical protein
MPYLGDAGKILDIQGIIAAIDETNSRQYSNSIGMLEKIILSAVGVSKDDFFQLEIGD